MLHHYGLLFVVALVLFVVAIISQVKNMRNVLQFKMNMGLVATTFLCGFLGMVSLVLSIIGFIKFS